MRNRTVMGMAGAAVLATVAATVGYASASNAVSAGSSPIFTTLPRTGPITAMAAHRDALHTGAAQSCIAHGQTCTINGTPCCNSKDSCKGTFPNTTCQ
jgi:hypothetical protein